MNICFPLKAWAGFETASLKSPCRLCYSMRHCTEDIFWLTDPDFEFNMSFWSYLQSFHITLGYRWKQKVAKRWFSIMNLLHISPTRNWTQTAASMEEIFIRRCNVFFSTLPSHLFVSQVQWRDKGLLPSEQNPRQCDSDEGRRCGKHEGLGWVWICGQQKGDISLKFALFSWMTVSLTHDLAAVLMCNKTFCFVFL